METKGITIETLETEPTPNEIQTLRTIRHGAFTAERREWDGVTRRVLFLKCQTEDHWLMFSPHYSVQQYTNGSLEMYNPIPVSIDRIIVRPTE